MDEIKVYLDMTCIPEVLGRVLKMHSTDEKLFALTVPILSTICQSRRVHGMSLIECSSDLILRGDIIELLVQGIVLYPFNATIMGHSVYCLYLLSTKSGGGETT